MNDVIKKETTESYSILQLTEALEGTMGALGRMLDLYNPDSIEAEWIGHAHEAIINTKGKSSNGEKYSYFRQVVPQYIGPRYKNMKINGPETASTYFRKFIKDHSVEQLAVLYLNGASSVISFSVVAKGSANVCHVEAREVFRMGVLLNATSIILAHNHPSGDALPSKKDISTTKNLCVIGKMIGIKVLDHIILTEQGYLSISEREPITFE